MENNKCIYCGCLNTSKEHYLPRGLGKFKGYEQLIGKVCAYCNNECGKLDEAFLRSSPEAALRCFHGISGRADKRRVRINPFYRGSAGLKPIRILGREPYGDCDIYWEITKGGITQLSQIIYKKKTGLMVSVIVDINKIKTGDDLKRLIKAKRLKTAKPMRIICYPHEFEWMKTITEEVYSCKAPNLEQADFENINTFVKINLQINVLYYRCLAKIALHYLLKHHQYFSGHEKEFTPIKDFIQKGYSTEDVDHFVQRYDRSIVYDYEGEWKPDKVGHVIVVEISQRHIMAKMRFFYGKAPFQSFNWIINIAQNPYVTLMNKSEGHFFMYYDDKHESKFDGDVQNVIIASHPLLYPFNIGNHQ